MDKYIKSLPPLATLRPFEAAARLDRRGVINRVVVQ